LPDVEVDSGVGIDGIEMQVMEAWRCEHRVLQKERPVWLALSSAHSRESGNPV
jgi:hypothetical protein